MTEANQRHLEQRFRQATEAASQSSASKVPEVEAVSPTMAAASTTSTDALLARRTSYTHLIGNSLDDVHEVDEEVEKAAEEELEADEEEEGGWEEAAALDGDGGQAGLWMNGTHEAQQKRPAESGHPAAKHSRAGGKLQEKMMETIPSSGGLKRRKMEQPIADTQETVKPAIQEAATQADQAKDTAVGSDATGSGDGAETSKGVIEVDIEEMENWMAEAKRRLAGYSIVRTQEELQALEDCIKVGRHTYWSSRFHYSPVYYFHLHHLKVAAYLALSLAVAMVQDS
ncbi:unnamed protein product [Protopolystoma xenopodis]|uniref:Uncharacterized protein n=1 Tax=Protopolystoma xenopodis TaxID=117903 RepID=A0A3S5B4E8_9PLAT|nr:unnamed protein product [Protopolystoma xenopodis]